MSLSAGQCSEHRSLLPVKGKDGVAPCHGYGGSGQSRTRPSAERGCSAIIGHRQLSAAPAPPGSRTPGTPCSCSRSHGERKTHCRALQRRPISPAPPDGQGALLPAAAFPAGLSAGRKTGAGWWPGPHRAPERPAAALPGRPPPRHTRGPLPAGGTGPQTRCTAPPAPLISSPTELPSLYQRKLVHTLCPLSKTAPPVHNLCPGGAVYAEIRRRCSCPGPAAWWCRPWRVTPRPSMVIMYRWFCTSAPPLFSVAAAVSSISPGLEGETQTAVPTRSITSQPMSPVRTCPLVRVTTVKVWTRPPVPPACRTAGQSGRSGRRSSDPPAP